MHDPVIVHLFQSHCHSLDELLDLSCREHCLLLVDAAVELAVGEQLEHNVDGVVRLEDALALDDVGAIECSQHLDLVEQVKAVAGIRRFEGGLLGEGLHSEVLLVSDPLHLIDGRKTALSNLLDGPVIPMEAVLVEMLSEMPDPDLHQRVVLGKELNLARIFLVQPESNSPGENCILGLGLAIKFVDGLKLDVKG